MSIELFKKELNLEQFNAVTTTEGPVLVLAGAGSGKTRVITYRIFYLIQIKNVKPYNILAVTFTNKAANEMKTRINLLYKKRIKNLLISTFHSLGVRILKQHINQLGYKNKFNIYDENDKKNLIKTVQKEMNIFKDKKYDINLIMKLISLAKNSNKNEKFFNKNKDDDEEFSFILLKSSSVSNNFFNFSNSSSIFIVFSL